MALHLQVQQDRSPCHTARVQTREPVGFKAGHTPRLFQQDLSHHGAHPPKALSCRKLTWYQHGPLSVFT